MWGAIIGDLAGSTYEYGQTKKIVPIKNIKELINSDSFFSDDIILTIAILDAILNNDTNYEKYLKEYGLRFIDYKPDFSPYFKTSFSPGFIKWLKSNETGCSCGNGAMMRISPVGYLFDSEGYVIRQARLATITSHNSEEAIYFATLIARIIFLARKGFDKKQIKEILQLKITEKPFTRFNTSCYETINNCLYSVFSANTYEDSLFKILSYGGDTDTNACIVGSMAEAMYGLNEDLIRQAEDKIPRDFVKKLEQGYKRIK